MLPPLIVHSGRPDLTPVLDTQAPPGDCLSPLAHLLRQLAARRRPQPPDLLPPAPPPPPPSTERTDAG